MNYEDQQQAGLVPESLGLAPVNCTTVTLMAVLGQSPEESSGERHVETGPGSLGFAYQNHF